MRGEATSVQTQNFASLHGLTALMQHIAPHAPQILPENGFTNRTTQRGAIPQPGRQPQPEGRLYLFKIKHIFVIG